MLNKLNELYTKHTSNTKSNIHTRVQSMFQDTTLWRFWVYVNLYDCLCALS